MDPIPRLEVVGSKVKVRSRTLELDEKQMSQDVAGQDMMLPGYFNMFGTAPNYRGPANFDAFPKAFNPAFDFDTQSFTSVNGPINERSKKNTPETLKKVALGFLLVLLGGLIVATGFLAGVKHWETKPAASETPTETLAQVLESRGMIVVPKSGQTTSSLIQPSQPKPPVPDVTGALAPPTSSQLVTVSPVLTVPTNPVPTTAPPQSPKTFPSQNPIVRPPQSSIILPSQPPPSPPPQPPTIPPSQTPPQPSTIPPPQPPTIPPPQPPTIPPPQPPTIPPPQPPTIPPPQPPTIPTPQPPTIPPPQPTTIPPPQPPPTDLPPQPSTVPSPPDSKLKIIVRPVSLTGTTVIACAYTDPLPPDLLVIFRLDGQGSAKPMAIFQSGGAPILNETLNPNLYAPVQNLQNETKFYGLQIRSVSCPDAKGFSCLVPQPALPPLIAEANMNLTLPPNVQKTSPIVPAKIIAGQNTTIACTSIEFNRKFVTWEMMKSQDTNFVPHIFPGQQLRGLQLNISADYNCDMYRSNNVVQTTFDLDMNGVKVRCVSGSTGYASASVTLNITSEIRK